MRRALSGAAREAAGQGSRPSQVKGPTGRDLQRIPAHLHPPEERRPAGSCRGDLALVQGMRDGLLRREAADLIRGDVIRVQGGSGRLNIRHTKTDAEGKGATPSTVAAPERMRPADAQPREAVFGPSGPDSTRIKTIAERVGLRPGYGGQGLPDRYGPGPGSPRCQAGALMTTGRWTNPTMPARYIRINRRPTTRWSSTAGTSAC